MIEITKDKKSSTWILTKTDSEGYHRQMNLTDSEIEQITIILSKNAMEKKRTLEETCASEVCAYRGKGVCSFVEGEDYCPMYTNGGNENENAE